MTISPSTMDIEEDHRPRYMVFSKMEKIIRDMQHPDTGVPVRCQKLFLTTIPCAFTGYDLIEWLMDKLQMSDLTEALHLASLMCQYGYFFPVAEHSKNCGVKDDSTLYRFQSPYFWPSQNWHPDNVDYAIYLAKRTMRNKQKHGLEDYEQQALNKLQKILCDKWDFVYMQAEEQVRLAKERKKADKMVIDSQEKAFWKVHCPPPGHLNCLEEGVRRNFKPSQMAQRKRKNIEACMKEIAFLQQALLRPRMKTSKAIESLVQRSEMYQEHDPMLQSPQPSNPWVTEDTTLWMLNNALVETPTERRVKLWAFSLRELLCDGTGRHEFESFLQKEFSSENIRFWQSCELLKFAPESQVRDKVNEIYNEFLAPGAPCEINIDGKTMELTQKNMQKPSRFTFEAAQAHIFLLMKKDSYARFLRSDHYQHLLNDAVNPCPKKRFFSFGTNKKKSPNPSPKPQRRRGSASSELSADRAKVGGLSQHSFSTGNLRDLEIDRSGKTSPFGSSGDLKVNGSSSSRESSGHSKKRFSPRSLRKKLDELVRSESSARSNLEVPTKHYPVHSPETKMDDNVSLHINVPNKTNIVAPWETSE